MSPNRHASFPRSCALLALVAVALHPGRCDAAPVQVCVDNDAAFNSAVLEATFVPVTIELVQGTYHVDGTEFDDSTCGGSCRAVAGGFSLLGGYTANCAGRTIAPANTVVTASLASSQFTIHAVGDATIEGIKVSAISSGMTVVWNHYANTVQDNVQAFIRRNIFAGNLQYRALGVDWIPDGDQSLTARVVNNLVHDNTLGGGADSCAVSLTTDPGDDAVFDLVNNTIVDNTGSGNGVCMGYSNGSGGFLAAYDNIMYGNSGVDLRTFSGTSAVAVDNVVGTHSYQGSVTALGTQTGDPKLNAAFHPIEAPASPVINSGSNDVPGGLPAHDLDGGPRIVGTTVDRGAFESSIDDAFIQTVTNNNNSGTGSLRAAINSANANGTGALITFDIGTGCGPHVITLQTPLPDIAVPVIINGYTQTGASPNDLDLGDDATICVILEADASASVDDAIGTAAGAPAGTQVTIKGLAFSRFLHAIDLQGGSGHEIAGNHFGGKVGGYSLSRNTTDIRLGTATHDVIVGGEDVANRNIIGDAGSTGISLQGGVVNAIAAGTNNNQIVNNYIGIGWSQASGDYTDRGNLTLNIRIAGHDNVITGNLIGYSGEGIELNGGDAAGNLIASNFIGTDADGANLGNSFQGVRLVGSSGDAPHGNTVRGNTIANNGSAGVGVEIGQGNKIRKNSIYSNGGLGIDLAGAGVTPNDDDGGLQVNDYADHGLNSPVLTAAIGGTDKGTVSGTLTTLPGDYTIDLYANASCDPSGHGEGQIWLRGVSVHVPTPAIGDQGTASFNASISFPLLGGRQITATATSASGDTSEFSACLSYTDDTIFAYGFDPPQA